MYTKYEMELWAKLSLGRIMGIDISSLVCADKPDLQDARRSVGIEVVEDCYPLEKRHERFIDEIWDKPFSSIPTEKIKRFRAENGDLRVVNDRIVSASLDEPKNDNPIHLIETIKGKIDKIMNGGYLKFCTYELYVFVGTVTLYESYVRQVMDEIHSYIGISPYTHIYLDGWYQLYDCDMRKNAAIHYEITREDRSAILEQIDA